MLVVGSVVADKKCGKSEHALAPHPHSNEKISAHKLQVTLGWRQGLSAHFTQNPPVFKMLL
jgi:hypothetical protein